MIIIQVVNGQAKRLLGLGRIREKAAIASWKLTPQCTRLSGQAELDHDDSYRGQSLRDDVVSGLQSSDPVARNVWVAGDDSEPLGYRLSH